MRRTRLPRDNGKVIDILRPGDVFLFFAQALELHGKLAFADLVLREGLQGKGQ